MVLCGYGTPGSSAPVASTMALCAWQRQLRAPASHACVPLTPRDQGPWSSMRNRHVHLCQGSRSKARHRDHSNQVKLQQVPSSISRSWVQEGVPSSQCRSRSRLLGNLVKQLQVKGREHLGSSKAVSQFR
jgi:hypothetical protein